MPIYKCQPQVGSLCYNMGGAVIQYLSISRQEGRPHRDRGHSDRARKTNRPGETYLERGVRERFFPRCVCPYGMRCLHARTSTQYLEDLVPHIIKCFTDSETRVSASYLSHFCASYLSHFCVRNRPSRAKLIALDLFWPS